MREEPLASLAVNLGDEAPGQRTREREDYSPGLGTFPS